MTQIIDVYLPFTVFDVLRMFGNEVLEIGGLGDQIFGVPWEGVMDGIEW